jgi:hypothetical protein
MEKAKNSHNPRRSLLKKMILGLLFVFGLVLVFVFTLAFINQKTRSGKHVVVEIPAELLPTAEYMVMHQPPTPEYLIVDFPRATENRTKIDICVLDRYFNDSFHTSRFFVNGSRIHASSIKRSLSSMSTYEKYEDLLSDQSSVACIQLPYRIGFYFLEFQRSVWMPGPLYQWAIRVVN